MSIGKELCRIFLK